MTIYNLPSDITNLISDTLHGDIEYWRCKYNDVLNDIKLHNPEYLVEVCFCNDKYELTTHTRWKDVYIDIACLDEYIHTSKFKSKLVLNVLEILLRMNHPLYELIEYELTQHCN